MALNKNQKIVSSVIIALVLATIILLILILPKVFSGKPTVSNTSTNPATASNIVSIPAMSISKIEIDIEGCKILTSEIAKKYLENDVENISNTKFTNITSCAYKDAQNNTIGINITEYKDATEADSFFETTKKANPKLEIIVDLKDKVGIDPNTFQLTFQKSKYGGSISIIKNGSTNFKESITNLYNEIKI